MEKNRLEAFSDGVIAVNITILVLELKAPHGEGFDALLPLVPTFLRRADRIDLHAATITAVERSYAGTFRDAGISISDDLVQHRTFCGT